MPYDTRQRGAMDVSRLWEPYGLRSSPFFQDELKPTDGDHPMSLFVGREEELRRIERRVVSDPHTRTIVEGDPGVGKTSFVNRVKADAAALSVATYEHPIRITQETSLATFVADVLRTIVRIRSAAELDNEQGKFWKRTVKWLEGGEIRGGSVSVFGVAGGVTRTFVPPQAPRDALYEHLGEALRRVTDELARPVLLHVNNLENLTGARAQETALLLRDLRDYLLLPGAHWVFVGATGIEDDLFRVYDQVGGIFPAADVLRPLTPAEIEQLLERRFEHLRVDGRVLVEPIVPREAAGLYALYQGDLRNFLRLLSDAADRILGVRSVAPMSQAEVLRHAAVDYQRQFRSRVSSTDFEHLAALVAGHGGADPEFRVTDAARLLKLSQPSASDLVQRLVERRLLHQTRTVGRSVYYRPTGAVLVAFGVSPDALTAEAR
jgi:AAA ATPase domain